MSAPTTSKTMAGIRIGAAIISAISGVSLSTWLLVSKELSEASFLVMLVIMLGFSFVVAVSDRIKNLQLYQLKFETERVQAARKEVEKIAMALGEITAFLAAFHRRMGSDETHDIEQRWLTKRVERLFDEIPLQTGEKQKAMEYLNAVQTMDSVRSTDQAAGMAIWKEIWAKVEREAK